MFTSPPLSLSLRNKFFGLTGKWSRVKFQTLNRQLLTLSRVVIHPTYRGAGLAAAFVRTSCRACAWPWIEALAQMGRFNAFFEKAGFVRVGSTSAGPDSREAHSALYGTRRDKHGRKRLVTQETHRKSQFAEPVYYIFDNREPRNIQADRAPCTHGRRSGTTPCDPTRSPHIPT